MNSKSDGHGRACPAIGILTGMAWPRSKKNIVNTLQIGSVRVAKGYNGWLTSARQSRLRRVRGGSPGISHVERHELFLDEGMMTSKGFPGQATNPGRLLLPWRRIAQQLCPLIGDSGFCALFVRTCHVVGPDYAWLAPLQPCRSPEQLFATLEERMALVEPARAAAANDAMLGTFTQLLAALIGEGLTQRLLATAMAPADTGPGLRKNAQEQK